MNKNIKNILIGILTSIITGIVFNSVLDFKMAVALSTLILMAYWWVTMCVPVGVTAFVPVIVNALFNVVPMQGIIANYASETVLLLIGSSIIAYAWEKTNLDKRVSLKAIGLIGTSLRSHVVVWFVIAAILSMFLPNAVVAAILLPIAVSMFKFIGEEDFSGINKSKVGASVLASIVWGAGIGGLGTPIGGAMNLVAISYIEELLNREYLFTEWAIKFIPAVFGLIIVCVLIILLQFKTNVQLKGSKEYFEEEYNKLPKISKEEIFSLVVFGLAVVLSFSRELYASLLPSLKPAYVFLTLGLLLCVVHINSKSVVSWKEAEKNIFWGTIFMFAGGMALGQMIVNTGVAEAIATLLININLTNPKVLIVILVLFTILMAEISNNTSAASISVPLCITLFKSMGLDPYPYVLVICAAFNCAFMLPTTIRSLAIGYGLSPKYLIQKGMLLTLAMWIVISLAGIILIK